MIGTAKPRSSRARRGAVTLEAILGVIVLVILFVAAFEFGVTGIVGHGISHAATVAAREAGKGANIAELGIVAETVLSPYNLTVGPSATVILEDPELVDSVQTVGGLICDPPASPVLVAGDVRVTVCVRADTQPFINCLAAFGVDISTRCIRASSVVRKER